MARGRKQSYGWVQKKRYSNGANWIFRWKTSDGRDACKTIGRVDEIGDDEDKAFRLARKMRLTDLPFGGLRMPAHASAGVVATSAITSQIQGDRVFSELADFYEKNGLPFHQKTGDAKCKGTQLTYRYHLDSHIRPRWDAVMASSIAPIDVESWLRGLHDDQDYNWQTVTKVKTIMAVVFKFAIRKKYWTGLNPIDRDAISLPAHDDPEIDSDTGKEITDPVLTIPQVFQLAASVGRGSYPQCATRLAVLLCGTTGLRISEAMALTWGAVEWDITLERGKKIPPHIRIYQTYRMGEVQNRTKSRRSRRNIPLCDQLACELKAWLSGVNGWTEKHERIPLPGDFVFASPRARNGPSHPLWGQTLNERYLKPAALKLGFITQEEKFGWHRLRHSALSEIADPEIACAVAGHSDSRITRDVYRHGDLDEQLVALSGLCEAGRKG